jgi:phosphinothricin acetyltransferase
VYVSSGARGQGIGRALIEAIIAASEAEGFWTLQAHIIAGNTPSRELFRVCGFREIGVRERLGHIDEVWHDVVLTERRSSRTGGPGLPGRRCGA